MNEEITIKVWATDQGGYMYDIFLTNDVDEDTESDDGGHCTSEEMADAIKMASDHAQGMFPKEDKRDQDNG